MCYMVVYLVVVLSVSLTFKFSIIYNCNYLWANILNAYIFFAIICKADYTSENAKSLEANQIENVMVERENASCTI